MTWRTPDGNRRLIGAEATLIRDALAIMVDRLSDNLDYPDDPIWDFGVGLFDELTPTQQLTVVRQIATYLLTETADTLGLSAVNEAAVYAIFHTISMEIEIEIDAENDPQSEGYGPEWLVYWRQRVLDAYNECFSKEEIEDFGDDDESSLPTVDCAEVDRWEWLVEELADRILWDRDFEMAEDFLDYEPAKAAVMKQIMGIDNDYYTDVATEVRADQIAAMLVSIRRMIHLKPR